MKLTKEEFFAYLLLYAAKADFVESPEEKAFILNKQSSPKELLNEIRAIMSVDGELGATEQMYLVGIRRLIMSA